MSFTPKGPKVQPEKDLKPKVDTPKYKLEKRPKKQIDKQTFNPNVKPRNNIEPYIIPPNYKPKNKIERLKLPPNYIPKNKIQIQTLPPNYKPKNKVERPTLPSNYKPKNKIEQHTFPSNYTPKNRIELKVPAKYGPRNKNESPKINPNCKTKSKEVNGNVKEKTHQKLYNDGKIKECGRCHDIKSLDEFENYIRSNTTVYERYCRPCRLEYKQIRALQNKTNIIRNIYGGNYAEKCPECNTKSIKVPAFDFHHPIKELKTKRINFHGNWMNTLKRLEKEKVIPSCRNCHLKKQSKYYNNYKELIEKKSDFESSIKGIEKKLYQLIYKHYPDKGHQEGYQIKSWISKRIVVERLYNGKCVGCGAKNLVALQFHHRDITKKTFQKYDKLRYTTIEKIEKKLIKDDAICLCGNCHRMTEAYYFEKNHQEIVGTKYSQEIRRFYKDLKENVKNFKFPAKILKQYPYINTEKIEIRWKPKSYKLSHDEKQIKEELKSINWEANSQNWKLPTGELLDPTKDSSQTNPLYKHKTWLEYIYSNYKWGLTDEKIARITNTSQTTINYWRKKLKIQTKKW